MTSDHAAPVEGHGSIQGCWADPPCCARTKPEPLRSSLPVRVDRPSSMQPELAPPLTWTQSPATAQREHPQDSLQGPHDLLPLPRRSPCRSDREILAVEW